MAWRSALARARSLVSLAGRPGRVVNRRDRRSRSSGRDPTPALLTPPSGDHQQRYLTRMAERAGPQLPVEHGSPSRIRGDRPHGGEIGWSLPGAAHYDQAACSGRACYPCCQPQGVPEMPDRITDPRPPEVAAQLANLAAALDQVIPAKQPGRNLLLGTWNVRAFDRLTPSGTRRWATPRSATSAICCAS